MVRGKKSSSKLNTIQEALKDLKRGKMVIVVDDASRENEGDFIIPARFATAQVINFMARYGRGLICVALTAKRCEELQLPMMVLNNTSTHETAFTVSVDLIGHGCTTGISASDRSKTIKALINPKTRPEDLARPGHIFPLRAQDGGVLRRAGHTEAAVDLSLLAGFEPAGVLVEIMKEDGRMARLHDLMKIARKHRLKIISIEDLIAYRLRNETLIQRQVEVRLPTQYGTFRLIAYKQLTTGQIHLALVKGNIKKNEPVLVRVHSSCLTGDIFGSFRCDCGSQLHEAMRMIEKEGKGVLVYMNQEGRGIGLLNKLKAYKLQEEGYDTVQANEILGFRMDERDYGIGAQILRDIGVTKMNLMTNNPTKRAGLIGYGLEIIKNIPIRIKPNQHNRHYLQTKKDKMGHHIDVK